MKTVQLGEKRVKPTKVVCVGRNYVEHIEELGNAIPEQMVVFNKPNSSISNRLNSFHQEPLHYEAEICFLIRRKKLAAVGMGLDLTKRDMQSKLKSKGLPWERAKAFDQSAVLSRFVSLDGVDLDDLSLELYINGVRIQSGHVSQMLYPPRVILQELSSYTSLETSDVIMTGTPKGVGIVCSGDKFTGRIKSDGRTIVEAEWLAE